jgi:hypothetical protein
VVIRPDTDMCICWSVDWRSNGSVHGMLLPTACTAAQMNAADRLLVGTYFEGM